MRFKVYTTDGKVAFISLGKDEAMDEAQAQARAEKANQEAERLGIKTRYEARAA